jgi:hypothetical protein
VALATADPTQKEKDHEHHPHEAHHNNRSRDLHARDLHAGASARAGL